MSACIPNVDVPIDFTNTVSPNIDIKVEKPDNINKDTIDVLELASLLQCLGFTLQSFEKVADTNTQPLSLPDEDNGYLQINLICTKSQMKAILLKQKSGCKCPSKEDASNAQFWNISACSPSLPGNLTVSKSSLIPAIEVNKLQEVNSLLLKALNIINAKDNQKVENFTDLFKTSTTLARPQSLENVKNECKDENSVVRVLSPRKTSSPILDSSNNANSISIDSEKASKLLETFRIAEKILIEAFNLNNQNSTFTKRVRRISDLKISPLATEDQKSGLLSVLSLSKPDSSSCKVTPKKVVSKRNIVSSGDKRKLLIPPSKIGVLKQKKIDSGNESSSRLLALKRETTPRSIICKQKPVKINLSASKINLSASKIKTTPKPDSLIKIRVPSKIASLTGTNSGKI